MAAFCVCHSLIISAKIDTTFLDAHLLPTQVQNATYYRVCVDSNQGIFKIIDFRMNHTIYCEGEYTSAKATIKQGTFQYYFPNGKLAESGHYHLGIKDSVWTYYYMNGQLKEVQTFTMNNASSEIKRYDSLHNWIFESGRLNADGRKIGPWVNFHYLLDMPKYIARFDNGFLHGEQLEYFKTGTLRRREFIEGYKRSKAEQYDENGKKVAYFPAFVYPEPPENIKKYLSLRVKCFDEALKAGNIQYKLLVKADGQVSDIQIKSEMDENCKQKLIACLARMKKWKPYRRENIAYDFTVERTLRYNNPRE